MLTRSGSLASRVGLSAVFALACSLPFAVPALAQCLGALYTQLICSKPKSDVDGKRHITVSFEGSDNLTVYGALSGAISEWNKYSDITGVVFETREWGATDGDLHVRFSDSEEANRKCVAYQPTAGPGIYWGIEFQARAVTPGLGQPQQTTVFMDELGHVLGLQHFPPGTEPLAIMNQNADCDSPTDVNNVTEADARQAASCLAANCGPKKVVRGGGGGTGSSCGYQETIDPTYSSEGDVTGYEVNYVWMCQ